jgi:hypothetical protein
MSILAQIDQQFACELLDGDRWKLRYPSTWIMSSTTRLAVTAAIPATAPDGEPVPGRVPGSRQAVTDATCGVTM